MLSVAAASSETKGNNDDDDDHTTFIKVVRCPVCHQYPTAPKKWPQCARYHPLPSASAAAAAAAASPSSSPPPPPLRTDPATGLSYASSCVIPTTWTPLELLGVTPYNEDVSFFDFALPQPASASATLQLPTCACLLLRAPGREHGGGDAVRPYTPVSRSSSTPGSFRLIIKNYTEWGLKYTGWGKTISPNWRPAGAVSSYLFSLEIGAWVDFKHVSGNVKLPYEPRLPGFQGVSTITMVCVGAGVAPMIQALHEILGGDHGGDDDDGGGDGGGGGGDDRTRVVMLYGNRSVTDILMKQQLDAWEAAFPPERFTVIHHIGTRWPTNIIMHKDDCPKGCGTPCERYTVPPLEGQEQLVGGAARLETSWINQATIARHGFPPAPDTRVFVCGLPAVYDKLCGPRGTPLAEGSALHRLGYTDGMVVKF